MAYMSYVRFEGTAHELKACIGDMEDAYTFEDLDHSEYEKVARKQLYDLAREYLAQYERLENATEEFELDPFEDAGVWSSEQRDR